ncbi:MAG: hypothetical protein AB2809_20430 [Candidatus Thiodiazotropha sp.]
MKKYTRRRKPKRPDSPMCSAPGCPLRYRHVLNSGQAFCGFHHGVKNSQRVHEITACLHVLKPVFGQIRILTCLNASQLLGRERVPVVESLPADCRQQLDESFERWKQRLIVFVDAYVATNGVIGGAVPDEQGNTGAACW